jgi:hypothetical protein
MHAMTREWFQNGKVRWTPFPVLKLTEKTYLQPQQTSSAFVAFSSYVTQTWEKRAEPETVVQPIFFLA